MTYCRPAPFLAIVAYLIAIPVAGADKTWLSLRGAHWFSPIPARVCCSGPTCCDDYLRKPIPCVAPHCGYLCDDYCGRCGVVPCRECDFVCDDYCRRPVPVISCPNCTQFHRCPPDDLPWPNVHFNEVKAAWGF